MTIAEAKQKVLNVARSNLGYHESGNNQTKFAASDWDNKFYGWELQGQPWCDVYADHCYCEPFGIEKGKQLTYQTRGGSALCSTSAQYYKNNNAFFDYPEVGDQAFFNYNGGINHTGIVESVTGSGNNWSSVVCIEGNTSDQVARRTYRRGDKVIAGFGRPNWKVVANDSNDSSSQEPAPAPTPIPTPIQEPILRFGMRRSEAVKKVQEDLIKLGYDLGRSGADGDFGLKTLNAVRKFQREHGLDADGQVGDLTRAAIKAALEKSDEIIVSDPTPTAPESFQKGDKVKIKEGATYYNSNVKVPKFVLNDTWIVYQVSGNRVVINKNANGTSAIMSPVNAQDLIKV